jgi:hypothetical protein
MKKTIIKISSLIAAGVILTTACSKTGATGPAGAAGATGATGATGPALTGTVVGYVDLFDQYGEMLSPSTAGEIYLTSSNSGLSSWKDSTYVNAGGISTYSAALSTGTYELNLAAKTGGFGNLVINSMNVVGGGVQYNTTHLQMTQAPTFTISSFAAAVGTSTLNPEITTTVTVGNVEPVKSRKIAIFFGNSSNVSSNPANYLGYTTATIAPNTSSVTVNLTCAGTLYPAGADSSNVIYLTAYPISYSTGASTYVDVNNTGRTIFNNVGMQAVGTPSVSVP